MIILCHQEINELREAAKQSALSASALHQIVLWVGSWHKSEMFPRESMCDMQQISQSVTEFETTKESTFTDRLNLSSLHVPNTHYYERRL